jgi:hypothetical protein
MVAPPGVEPHPIAELSDIPIDSRQDAATRVDVSPREPVAFGPTKSTSAATIEDALARALTLAAEGGRFDVVAQLATELQARRLSSSGAVDLADERERRRNR